MLPASFRWFGAKLMTNGNAGTGHPESPPDSVGKILVMKHITLPVFSDQGQLKTWEVLEVDAVPPGRYRLRHSPAFVDGLAAGDVIELDESAREGFRVLSRGGNLAVIVAFEEDQDRSTGLVERLAKAIKALGGTKDGGPARLLVFTVPVGAGFDAVEKLLNGFVAEQSGTNWWYGNVYEAGDALRPLNWWKRT